MTLAPLRKNGQGRPCITRLELWLERRTEFLRKPFRRLAADAAPCLEAPCGSGRMKSACQPLACPGPLHRPRLALISKRSRRIWFMDLQRT